MASSGGLTRRRGAGGGPVAGGPSSTLDDEDTSRVSSPKPKESDSRAPETSYLGGENGHKIAYDPKDIGESEERSKQPKLTLMEEVLLMGLKDKQVQNSPQEILRKGLVGSQEVIHTGLPFILERQHILRSTRLHRHRARLPRPDKHAERLLETAVPTRGPGH